jgi:hypothetical protein
LGLLGMPGSKRLHLETPDLEAPVLRADVAVIAKRAWEDRLRAEYVGVMIMRRFHGILVDLNAPMDLQELALCMVLQEQQHTRLCAAAAAALGSTLDIAFDLEELQQARDQAPLEEQAMAMILGTFLCGEGCAFELLKFSIADVPKNGFSEILRRIISDEVMHAGLGIKLLTSLRQTPKNGWLDYPGDGWAGAFIERQIAMMRGRAVIEEDEAELFDDAQAAQQLRSVAIANSRDFFSCYHQTLDHRLPGLLARAGLAVGQ